MTHKMTPAERSRAKQEDRKRKAREKFEAEMNAIKKDEPIVSRKEFKEETRYFVIIGKHVLASKTGRMFVDEALKEQHQDGEIAARDQFLLEKRGHSF